MPMNRKDGSSTRPLWAEEFSVHGAEDAYVLRRQFTRFLVLTSLGLATGNAWIWVRSLLAAPPDAYPEQVVARGAEIPVGGVRLFSYPSEIDPAILFRRADGTLAAFSQKCTHLACAVFYSAEHDRLECPCHVGYFSARTGQVLQGPPPRPLPRIRIEERDGLIIATGVDLQGDEA
jgi:Rieske Fe-S protein